MKPELLELCTAALMDRRVLAFLRVVREGESNQIDDPADPRCAYTLINGGAHFASFAAHPFAGLKTSQGGRAAGAPQFIPSTWAEVADELGLTGFTPYEQELGAVRRIHYRGALRDVIDGKLADAIAKCRDEWTSLPGAAENSGKYTEVHAREVFERWQNVLDLRAAPREWGRAQPTAPIEDRGTPYQPQPEVTMPIPAAVAGFGLLAELLPKVLELFAPRVNAQVQKATGADAATAQAFTADLFKALGGITGKTDPVQIVAVLQTEKAAATTPTVPTPMIRAAEDYSLDYLDKLAPMFDRLLAAEQQERGADEASIAAAAARFPDGWDPAKPLVYGALASMGAMMLFVFAIAAWQTVVKAGPSTEVWAAVTGIIGFVTGIVATIYAFRFGSSRSSATKNAIITELANVRRG